MYKILPIAIAIIFLLWPVVAKNMDTEHSELVSEEVLFTSPAEKIQSPQFVSIEAVIREYDWPHDIALAVARAESGLNPNALNPEWHRGCQGSIGVFQLACLHSDGRDLFDPNVNIEIAYNLWKREGWRPWTVCRTMVACEGG